MATLRATEMCCFVDLFEARVLVAASQTVLLVSLLVVSVMIIGRLVCDHQICVVASIMSFGSLVCDHQICVVASIMSFGSLVCDHQICVVASVMFCMARYLYLNFDNHIRQKSYSFPHTSKTRHMHRSILSSPIIFLLLHNVKPRLTETYLTLWCDCSFHKHTSHCRRS